MLENGQFICVVSLHVIVFQSEITMLENGQFICVVSLHVIVFQSEITMLENGQFICVDCNYVTDKKSNWFKHRRKHLGKS